MSWKRKVEGKESTAMEGKKKKKKGDDAGQMFEAGWKKDFLVSFFFCFPGEEDEESRSDGVRGSQESGVFLVFGPGLAKLSSGRSEAVVVVPGEGLVRGPTGRKGRDGKERDES